MSNYDVVDLTATLVSQSTRAFGMALQCQVTLANIQTRNKASVDKSASIEEEIKTLRAKVVAMKAENIEDVAKFVSTLAKINALKKEVHKSQCEVTSLTKKVETSNNHQKLTSKPKNRPTCNSRGLETLGLNMVRFG